MTYMKWRDADGYESGCRECLDLSSLAADLCKALDGKPISTGDRGGMVTFELGDGCKLSLSNGWRSFEVDKVTVHIDPPAAEVEERIIIAAQAPLARLHEFARQLERDGRPLEMIGREYAAQFPELEITVPEFSDHRGNVRGSAPIYLLGDFYWDGGVSIERMELTRAQFERVVRALREKD
jgi:hypothetical protein